MTEAAGTYATMTDATELAYLDLVDAAAAVAAKRVSSRELTEALIARIERWQPHVNAFTSFEPEAALLAADRADASEPTRPLHGVPLAHKDMFYAAGKVVSCGSALRADWVATETATVLERLEAAGQIRLGALGMAEFAYGVTGHNSHFGHARNPWNPERITGGSSSGSGVAVAAGLSFAALGSDTGGSVRLPAHFCGVTGLKTTLGLVSRANAMPLSSTLDTIGPLARSARDLRLIMRLVAGPDPLDGETGEPWREDDRPASAMTIGVPTSFYVEDLDADVASAFQQAIETFRSLGCRIVSVDLPDEALLSSAALIALGAEAAALHRRNLAERPELYGEQTRARLINGFGYSGVQYVDALRGRGPALARRIEHMGACDAVIAPIARFPAPPIADTDVGARFDGVVAAVSALMRPVNYLGLPAIALPAGLSRDGLPIGVQVMGRPFNDPALLTLGEAFQSATDHHRRRPPDPS
ncbi:amidase [Methylopila capsulata]|uniref:Indoleacetamide hydrolase n=2 Tax=Methylopila capsulata TaxID=61654 RepID=A0A9W6MTX8_9HYPH|nr:amidase [Methylopila capsulata]